MPRFKHGIVVAAHPLAARAGVDILKKGGNAVDAAAATALALGTVTPAFCGIGGGGFGLVRVASEERAIFVDFRERAPLASKEDMFRISRTGNVFRDENSIGYKSVAVPGSVAGHSLMIEKYGRLPLKDVLEPATRYARRGFEVSRTMAFVWKRSVSKLRPFRESRTIYLRRGRPYREGDKIRLRDLAKSFASIARRGPDEFYNDRISKMISEDMASNDGRLSHEDLERYTPTIRDPIRSTYGDYEVLSAPPPSSGGAIVLQTLNMLEGYQLKGLGHNSPRALHLISEALMRSCNSIRPRICDPDFSQIPMSELVSKDIARKAAASIMPDKASNSIESSGIRPADASNTSHLTVIDEERNVVALTESVESYFGSGVVVPGTGILLNDTMGDFEASPGHLNSVEPWKVPMSSMCPTLVMKDGRPFMAVGSAGATRIVSSVLQTILNILEFDMSAESAVAAPRFHTQDSLIQVESGIERGSVEKLREMGHLVESKRPSSARLYFGGVHAALVRSENGELEGGADPRRDGTALGY
jgi:gamma-glutamyltranspeptidase / glutathione hydrolase